ncbi:MAG: hypothetical protein PHD97_00210 [Bacteroidales bacterium]|nr:hypothetical protein [Bacteroidales bacterium]
MSKQQKQKAKQKVVQQKAVTDKASGGQNYFERNHSYIITIVFFLLSLAGILNHEMWRDEYQAWMVADDAHSIPQLFHNLKYEGNPVLWHLLLFGLTSITGNAFIMQIVHIIISAAFIFLINKYSPFSILQKILLTFGYYTFFEFNMISRGYGLGFLLVVIVCILYKNRYRYYLPVSVLLFLLANSTIFGLMLSVSFAFIILLDYVILKKQNKVENFQFYKIAIAGIIIIAGWITGLIQMLPSPDSTFPLSYLEHYTFSMVRFKYSFICSLGAYLPIPDFWDSYFWNTNLFIKNFHTPNLIFSLIVFLIYIIGFLRNRLITLFFTAGTLLQIAFYYYTMMPTLYRYVGHFTVLLIICTWINHYYNEDKYKNKLLKNLSYLGKKISKPLFTIILVISFVGGIGSYYLDLIHPFSTNYKAAKFIRENKLQDLKIIGAIDFIVSPLAVELQKKIYYSQRKEFGTFAVWDKKRKLNPDIDDLFAAIDVMQKAGETKFLAVLSYPIAQVINGQKIELTSEMLTDNMKGTLLKNIKPGIVENETYFIYLIEKVK